MFQCVFSGLGQVKWRQHECTYCLFVTMMNYMLTCPKVLTDEGSLTPARTGRAHWVPLLQQLSSRHCGDRDVDQPDIAAFVLLLLPVRVFVEVESNGTDGWKTAEVETFSPKYVVSLQLTGRTSIKAVVQTQFTEVPEVQILQLHQHAGHGSVPPAYMFSYSAPNHMLKFSPLPLLGR